MAGSDQSVNLGGMLTQIGQTLGTQGDSYRDSLATNITKITQPKLDMSDPDSIDNYTNWGVKTGQLTPGQASQYGWLSQKARTEQQNQKRMDGLQAFKATNTQLNTLKQQRAAAEASGNAAAVAKMDELIAGTQNAVNQQQALLEQDPVTADALYKEKQRAQQEATWRRQAERRAEVEQTNARNDEITGRSNNLLTAMLSGVLDVSALEPLPENATDAERAANAQKRSQIEAVQQGDIESYEHALSRYSKAKDDQKKIADKVQNDVVLTDAEFTDLGFTSSQVTQYKAILSQFGTERAGNWAMKALEANQAQNAKTDVSYKWTDEVSKTWMKTTSDIMSDIVMSSMEGEAPTGIGAVLANMSEDGRKDLAARVLNRLRSSGIRPTEESAAVAIKGILEGRMANKGKDADPIADEGWFSKLTGWLSGGESVVEMRANAESPTATQEAVEFTPAQQNTIARAMELAPEGMTRADVIKRLKDNGKL